MASRDLVHRINVVNSIPSTQVTTNTTTNGVGVDTLGYESMTMLAEVVGWTAGGTLAFKLQTAPDNATWVDLGSSSVQTVGGITTVNTPANQVIGGVNAVSLAAVGLVLLGVSDCLRYLRAVCVNTGITTNATMVVYLILGHPRHSGNAV